MDIRLDENKSILFLKPDSALTTEIFSQVSMIIDPYIERHGMLKGIVIETKYFPGWENVSSFIAHVKFIKKHHAKIQKIAIVTDSKIADLVMLCVGPFVHPTIKHFPYGQISPATQWISM